MVEKKYSYTVGETKTIEQIILDENVNINHTILLKDDRLPEHFSNSIVYMIVARGTVTLALDEQESHSYAKGAILNVPYKTKMNVFNNHDDILELFIVKSPSPLSFKK